MEHAIRQRVVVQPGGTIQVTCSELPVGRSAEVIILLDSPTERLRSLSELIGAAQGCYADAAEADRVLKEERDTWGC